MDFTQNSFSGGMNLLVDDTRLPLISQYKLGDNPYMVGYNQYREAFNVRNRYDVLRPIKSGVKDPAAPPGIKQELVTFGNYVILFVAGYAWYRYYTDTGWTKINGFKMSSTAPRFWTCVVPVGTTNYVRLSITGTQNTNTVNPAGGIQTSTVLGANAGNNPGLLVQDNINQPQFIFLDANGNPTVRTTQNFSEWSITYTDDTNVEVVSDGDKREYVPVGNVMAWNNGILFIASQDGNYIYRSVSGRPLDFVVNVTNLLVTVAPYTQVGGGDATTTSYSVGVGGITTLRPISTGGIFVAASNANFSVTLNTTPNAPTLFGEYTFIRTFLFNATCLSDRCIIDSLGDTKFIDLTGIRSFNAIQQEQNEGRNSQFSATINSAFTGIVQEPSLAAAILYDNYEIYAVNSIFNPVIAIFDTILGVWTAFDTQQTGGQRVKAFAKIELTIQRLYAITENDELYTLYQSPDYSTAYMRFGAIANSPEMSQSVENVRAVFNNVTQDFTASAITFTDNRQTQQAVDTKTTRYVPPVYPYSGLVNMPDINTQVTNLYWSFPNSQQGWKSFVIMQWTGGCDLVYVTMSVSENKTKNPLMTQGTTT